MKRKKKNLGNRRDSGNCNYLPLHSPAAPSSALGHHEWLSQGRSWWIVWKEVGKSVAQVYHSCYCLQKTVKYEKHQLLIKPPFRQKSPSTRTLNREEKQGSFCHFVNGWHTFHKWERGKKETTIKPSLRSDRCHFSETRVHTEAIPEALMRHVFKWYADMPERSDTFTTSWGGGQ